MTCPSPEIAAAMAEGRPPDADREAFLDHAAGCDDCRHAALILTTPRVATVRLVPRTAGRGWIPWTAAAAVALSIVGLLLLATDPAPETKAVRATPKKEAEVPKPPAPIEIPKPPAPRPIEPALEPVKPPAPKPVEPAPVTPPAPTPENPTPEPPKPAPTPESPRPVTEVTVAVLHRIEGEVFVVNGTVRTPAKAGQELRGGDGLECRGPHSW